MVEEELRPFPSQGWAEMIRKVYEVDPMVCPQCGGTMKVIAFLTDYPVVDRIINHLKLTFVAERPPPPHLAYQEVLMAADLCFLTMVGDDNKGENAAVASGPEKLISLYDDVMQVLFMAPPFFFFFL